MNVMNPSEVAANLGNPTYFTGAVHLRPMMSADDVMMLRVEFPAGARTNWHTHDGVQILVVLEGRCRFQNEGGPIGEACVGETIYIPSGEKHWHGATPGAPMVHLAVNIALKTKWLEPVTEEQYGAR